MKKLLALVLALVMTMSLVTISNAAFKDADKISNKEAVDVMAAVGVLAGYDNGEFGATDTLTRAQACKIIAYLDLGGKTADAIKGTGTVFSDVKATDWFAGFVEYCAGAGYVAGVGDKKFAPNEKVTGVQFAKMLLCALGYSAEIEGYTGADYTIAIARDANKNDLYKDLSIAASANLTREQAAQMAFNALKATCVEYRGGTSVSTSDGTKVTVGATRYESTTTKEYLASGTSDDMQLAEKLYGNDLKLATNATTAFGAPANTWTYKSDEVGTYAKAADKVLAGTVTKGDLYSAIGSVAMDNKGAISVEVDGKSVGTTATYLNGIAVKGKTAVADELAFTGNGTKTEVYVSYNSSSRAYDITVIVVNTYLAKVSSVTEATASAKRYVTVSFKSQTAAANAGSGAQVMTFETESFAKNDYVLVTCAENSSSDFAIKTMTKAPAVVSGDVASVKGTSNFVIGSTTYKYAAQVARTAGAIVAPNLGDTIDVYCDANGYVLFYEVTAASAALENYLVVLASANDSLAGTVKANVVTLDGGIKKSVTLGKLGDTKITSTSQVALNKIYSFSVNANGDYDIKAVAAPFSTTDYTVASNAAYATGALTFNGAKVNAATTFVIYDKADGSVKLYTGMTAAPTVAAAADNKADVLVKASNSVASAVFMNVAASASITDTSAATEIVYVLDGTPVVTKSGSDTIRTYSVIKDNAVTTLSTKNTTSYLNAVGTWKITQYSGEYVSNAAAVGNTTGDSVGSNYKVYKVDFAGAAADVDFADGIFTFGTYSILADTDVIAWSITETNEATQTTLSGLVRENSTYEYYVVAKKNSSNNLYYVNGAYCQK